MKDAKLALHEQVDLLLERFQKIRRFTQDLVAPLSPEDCSVQSMPDASPTKWHLAHTSWFFETFLLRSLPEYRPLSEEFAYLFNSYYNTVGEQFPRAQRGVISRPGLTDVLEYRSHVDEHMARMLSSTTDIEEIRNTLEIGLQHEQQHQELILTDIKHVFAQNPLLPIYRDGKHDDSANALPLSWRSFDEGLYETGHDGRGFCFDNELPRHRNFVENFQMANRLVTCGEYLEFMQDGGYTRPELWLSQGWAAVCQQQWSAPLYWREHDGSWKLFTLAGPRDVVLDEPVCHISYFEADAFARWAGSRLPTEIEWEIAAAKSNTHSQNFADALLQSNFAIHPRCESHSAEDTISPLGNVWQWTSSQYTAYPGYAPPAGALGEYNGKFMCNQFVLRGGSCATSFSHIRPTYRNFFPPDARWQFSGIRLARDVANTQ